MATIVKAAKSGQCDGKFPFLDRGKAEVVVRRMNQKHKKVHAYKCPWCSNWHVGRANGKLKP